ncbi:LLM class F420-dependent oxidoreductase [Frankia sp. CNm7]|uniref:LLM class F420-dependent oxidoreductase n=1 Tax=Frankia nepalensis TaxID=1836974 RepID=A0A937RQ58_9ACTN|nr:LLM class F420-dependent oxidoreductase [Frankia nepalensis]MBL7494939.1 LLM class F420-dependent oxidoreductase [Frankia nepalensis]MBL7515280.1 LLM class F420-dependent oxidoreductase [Frankia nepalensis]MBL7521223.1 LLM class F420-dependent oxidoreductase [Frankia nepalensis]MBL7632950.1 LLM class F420-dependent oxidoreductase [Frankia nepalensis]
MRLGVTFPQNELASDPDALRRFAMAAEQLGYDHLLLYDHVVGAVHGVDRQPPLPERSYHEKDPFHDPLVAFGYLAAVTRRIELVTGILILPQRQTVLVARQAADVALFSEGRLRLGVGIGYNAVEYHALGQEWATRGRRLDEQIPYLRRLWSGEPQQFSGRFDQIDRAALCPPPNGPIPIWLGGSSEAAFRRAARLADGFIFGYGLREDATLAWQRVQELLRAQRRAPEDFRALFNLLPNEPGSWLGQTVAALPRLRDAGATDVAVTSARNGLTTLDQHLDFIAEMKQRADAVLG